MNLGQKIEQKVEQKVERKMEQEKPTTGDGEVRHEFKYTPTKILSVPSISMREPGEYFLQSTAPIHSRPDRVNPDKEIHTMRVRDLRTQALGEIVLAKLLLEIFREHYPEPDAIVGKAFRIVKKPSGKRGVGTQEYNLFFVEEIAI